MSYQDSDGCWQVRSERATFGLVVQDGIVIEAAPYGRKWCVGREWAELRLWLDYRGYTVTFISSAGTLDNLTGIE